VGWIEWDHNAFYHRLLLRQIPVPCERALDVGCGAGTFAARLAGHAWQVDAADRSPVMIDAARAVVPGNVTCLLSDVMRDELAAEGYDAIFSISALHHLELEEALRRLAAALRPGGVLAVIALPRQDWPREIPVELVATAGYRLLGAAFAAARFASRGTWFALETDHDAMPVVLDPPLTTRAVRTTAMAVLPGARVRRLVYWRYLLTWTKPANPATPASAHLDLQPGRTSRGQCRAQFRRMQCRLKACSP
jgi:SAM-dependent methyltransferase